MKPAFILRLLSVFLLSVLLFTAAISCAESGADTSEILTDTVTETPAIYTATGFNNFFKAQTKKGAEVASTIAKNEKTWTTALDKILKALEENAK